MKVFRDEPPPKLIVSRRAIAAGLSALVAAPAGAKTALAALSNVPLSFDASEFTNVMRDGLFLPDYRFPMARIVFEDGGTTRWMRWVVSPRQGGGSYAGGAHKPARTVVASAIECCAPDKNGAPRYTQLQIG